MNTNIIKSKKLVLLVILAFVAMSLLPLNTIVAYAAPEDNVTVEYRYTEGDTVTVPSTIMQLGREYRLISRAEPVLESTLPQVRTYNYRITGALTSAEAAILQNADPYLSISPVNVVMEREIDKTDYLTGLPTNDVDRISPSKAFEVTSATAASGKEMVTLVRAGIEFDVESEELPGLPSSYKATVIYRGIETYNEVGYYLAENTYQSQVTEGEENVYIIIATYEPTDLDQEVVAAPVAQPPAPTPTPEPEPTAEFTEEQLALLGAQVPLSDGPLGPIKNIVDGLTPLGGFGVTSAWSVASLFMSMIAIIFAIIVVVGMITGKNKNSAAALAGNEQATAKNNGLFKILALIFSALTLITWLFVDDLSLPQVWINKGTLFVGVVFVINLILFIISSQKSAKAKQNVEAEPEASIMQNDASEKIEDTDNSAA